MNSWLEKSALEMYSKHNEEKSAVAERFIRTLKNKIYKYMTSISKNVYIDKLDVIGNKYNNTYHSAIKMKPVDAKSNTYIDSSKEINHKNPKFKIVDIVMISKHFFSFVKGFSKFVKRIFCDKKVKNTVLWTYIISDLDGEEIVGAFHKKTVTKNK